MGTAITPYRHGGPSGLVKVRQSLTSAVRSLASLFRASNSYWGTAGWSIVRGTQPSTFQGSGDEVRLQGWERHPVVNACARVVVDLIKAVPLEVYKKQSDGTAVVLGKSPALDLLGSPRQGLSGGRLIARTAMAFFLYGNAFWLLERRGSSTRGAPRSIRVIQPDRIKYVWLDAETDAITAYDWQDMQDQIHSREPVENIVHFRDLDAGDGLFGFPRLASALLDILSDTEASQYVRQVVTNHGVPGMVVQVDGAPTPAELQAGEARWREKYTTRGHRAMTAFMAGVKDITPIGFDLQQLEFPDLRRVSREDICAAASVDPRMIGVASASSDGGLSGEQYREARFRLIQQTVYPIMRAIEDEMNYWFMPEYGEALVRFSEEYIAAITEDVTQTSTRVVAEVAAKIRTVEEAREAVGLEAEMDPTHTLPGGLTVADNAANTAALGAAAVKAAENPMPPVVPSSNGTKPNGATKPTSPASARALVRAHVSAPDTAPLESEYERAALHQFSLEREDWLRVLAALAVGRALFTDVEAATVLHRVATTYSPDGPAYRAWVTRFDELVGRAVRAGGEQLADEGGLDFSLANPKVQGLIRRRTADLASSVTATTRDAIRAAVVAGRQQNFSIPQVAQLITDTTFGAISKSRAQTIARTEVVGALVSGEYAAAVQSGVMRSKRWIANMDDRVRDSHAAINGEVRDMGAAFSNGLRYPHDPLGPPNETINCRCSLAFSDLEAHDARR